MRVAIEVIEPCGFPLSAPALKRAALDYGAAAQVIRRASWTEFLAAPERALGRLVLFTTKAMTSYVDFTFQPGDTLLFGQESAGVPDHVHDAVQARLILLMAPGARSLNVVASAAMALGEALRQTAGFPASPQTR